MNNTEPSNKNEDCFNSVRLPFLPKDTPQLVDEDMDNDDALFFELPEGKSNILPCNKSFQENFRLVPNPADVSASLLRRVRREVSAKDFDPRIVFTACRGLKMGSPKFEEAYIAERIRLFTKNRRSASDYILCNPLLDKYPPNSTNFRTKSQQPPPSHPMAVIHLDHLMRHFGIWVIALSGVQILCVWKIGAFVDEYLVGGSIFYFSIGLVLMLALDTWVWFSRRGNLSSAFHVPGILLFLSALLPILMLHILNVLRLLE